MINQLDMFDIGEVVPAGSAANRRSRDRYEANWPARCSVAGQIWDVTVIDASTGGLGIDRELPLAKGQVLSIELTGIGTYACRIAWQGGNRCGLQFLKEEDELSEAAVDSLADVLASMTSS